MEPSLGRDVGSYDDELPLKSDCLYQIQEEALAGAESSHDEPDGRASVLNLFQVLQNGGDLPLAAHLDVVQSDARDDTRGQRAQDRGLFPIRDPQLSAHVLLPSL